MALPEFLRSSLLVAVGGGAGAWLRFAVGRWLEGSPLPAATLLVNLSGSFAMGLLAGWLARHGGGETTRLLLGVGLLGGFTTFSAFSLEIVQMAQRGSIGLAAGYAVVSVIAGIGGLLLGLALMRSLA